MSAVQFYKPGHMRWFVLIGSTQQHLYRATFTSLEYGGELGVWFVEKTGKFAFVCSSEIATKTRITQDFEIMQ